MRVFTWALASVPLVSSMVFAIKMKDMACAFPLEHLLLNASLSACMALPEQPENLAFSFQCAGSDFLCLESGGLGRSTSSQFGSCSQVSVRLSEDSDSGCPPRRKCMTNKGCVLNAQMAPYSRCRWHQRIYFYCLLWSSN